MFPFIEELVARAQADGLQLTGEGGLLQQLMKRLLESALDGEMTDRLGYDKHNPAGKNGGNSRNGKRSKTVLTDVGPVGIEVPRDREGSFEPQIVKKRQRRLTGVDETVLSLSVKGLTHGEISAHLAEVCGAEVSKMTISTITDAVMEGMAEWQSRPLDRGLRFGRRLGRSSVLNGSPGPFDTALTPCGQHTHMITTACLYGHGRGLPRTRSPFRFRGIRLGGRGLRRSFPAASRTSGRQSLGN